jgi:histidine ammonia-lyase
MSVKSSKITTPIRLDGETLSIESIVAIGIGDRKVELDPVSLEKCRASRAFLEAEVNQKRIIYGVNTSFGPMCNKIISDQELEALQVNLIRSHAAGLGDPIKPYIALGILAVRLNTLAKGYSGVRVELLEFMADLINRGIAPYIPECGSVGASGDLIHLAHLALGLIGEGKLYHNKVLKPASEVFAAEGITPFTLKYKEGIALINGTSAMVGVAAFALFGAKKMLNLACANAAFAVEIFGGIDDAWDEDLHRVKPHKGQVLMAATIRNLYEGSRNIVRRSEMHERIRNQHKDGLVFETNINVQDVYSIRCTPQLLAPVYDAIEYATLTVETEANSSNDNPIIIPEKKKIIHGGNFHGQSISYAMDMLAIGISQLCNLSERRTNKLLDKSLNEGLPEHLIAGTVGLTMGFMGAQYLATSTTAENRHLANPVSTHSISCNASNQDVVSMGTISALRTFRLISKAKHVLTLETLADLQALSFRNADQMGTAITRIYRILLKHFSVYRNERVFHDDLVRMRNILFSSQIFDDLSQYSIEANAADNPQ